MVRLCAAAVLMLISAVAFADSVEQLGQALLKDRSYAVRAQAAVVLGRLQDRRGVPLLVSALNDKEPAVRVVAAASLAKLGDPAALPALRARLEDPEPAVRSAAGRAISIIESASEPGPSNLAVATGPSRFSLDLSLPTSSPGREESARYTHRELTTQLGRLRGVVLTPVPGLLRYVVTTKIAKLSTSPPDARGMVQVECDLNIIVATYPERTIRMMATVGGNLEERNDPKGLNDAKNFCLSDAAKQAAEKVQTYLQGVR
jgi:hypothetical protein